jgi:hypothetical protein
MSDTEARELRGKLSVEFGGPEPTIDFKALLPNAVKRKLGYIIGREG